MSIYCFHTHNVYVIEMFTIYYQLYYRKGREKIYKQIIDKKSMCERESHIIYKSKSPYYTEEFKV